MAHIFGAQRKSFQVQNFIFGGLGRHFFQTLFTFRKLRIISKIEDLVVCGYGFMRYKGNWVFKKWGCFEFQEMRINPHFLKAFYRAKQKKEVFKKWGLILNSWKPPKKHHGSSLSSIIWGEKTHKKWPHFFCGFLRHIKNTFCKKIGPKQSIQPSAVANIICCRLYGVATAN